MRSKTPVFVALLLFLVALIPVFADEPPDERAQALIAFAKAVSARDLDKSQPDVSLESWLTCFFGADATITWAVGTCDIKPIYDSPDTWPLCVEISAVKANVMGVRLHVLLGTYAEAPVGRPLVHDQTFVWRWCDKCEPGRGTWPCTTFGMTSLSDVANSLQALLHREKCG